MDSDAVLVLSLLVLGYSLISGRLAGSPVTPAMAFAVAGLLAGPEVLGIVDEPIDGAAFRHIAELALTVLLFTEASRLDLGALLRGRQLPVRLLGIGLPLTMALGTLLALLLLGSLSFWEAAVLGVVLAPTDAALGQAVVSDSRVPGLVRRSLNAESGLNDGLALPFLIIALAFAEQGADGGSFGHWLWFIVRTVGVSVLVGAAIGLIGGRLLKWGAETGWVVKRFAELSIIALAVVSFEVVEHVDGSGFVGAFVAGITLGAAAPRVAAGEETTAAAIGELLTLVVFGLFGAAALWPAFDGVDVQVIVYALLSLTVVRMMPVAVSLAGGDFARPTSLFLGWFGPRGIASLIFALLVVEEADLPATPLIVQTVVVTVAISIVAHGLTAPRGAAMYAAAMDGLRRRWPEAPELEGERGEASALGSRPLSE
jgi:NhaP-type Na+/H+ or K+/H+ antiporter